MECKNKLKTAKKKITDVLFKLSEDEEVLRQAAIENVKIIIQENGGNEDFKDVRNILVEILMNIIVYSSVNGKIKDLDKFVSDVPNISNLSDVVRFQSMNVLLESKIYCEIDIFRRLLGNTIKNSKDDIDKCVVPENVFRPLITSIILNHNNEHELLLEVVYFLHLNTHCISICIERCFKFKEYDLIIEILKKLLPIVDKYTRIEIFTNLHFNLLEHEMEVNIKNSDFSKKKQYLVSILLINTNNQSNLLLALIPMVLQSNIREMFSTFLCLYILLYLIKAFEKTNVIGKLSNTIELLSMFKIIVKSGGIIELKHENINCIVNLVVITMSILLYKTTDIDEFELIFEIVWIIFDNFKEVCTLPFLSSLIYHYKGDIVQDNSIKSKSKYILSEMFNINNFGDLSDIKVKISEFDYLEKDEINKEINHLFNRYGFFDVLEENTLIDLKSSVYSSLYLGLHFIELHKNIESQSFNININNKVYFYVVSYTLMKYYLGGSLYFDKLRRLFLKLTTNEYICKIELFDSIFPVYEFIFNKLEQNNNYGFLHLIYDSLISFGNDKNTLPVVYNRIKKSGDCNTSILKKVYFLFLKGELPFSKIENYLNNEINSELSESKIGQICNESKGFRTLFCILRFKPDVINENFIVNLQHGLKSNNKYVISASLNCLTELCKFGIFDLDKTIKILFGLHSNVLLTEIRMPDNILPLVAAPNQIFGLNYRHFPVEVLSSFLRFFNVYLHEYWPSEDNFSKRIPNNIFYILSLMIQIIKDNKELISIYSINIISNLFKEYFYQNYSFDETLHHFIKWCIDNCFESEINNLFHFLELLQSFVSRKNYDFEINSLNFIVDNLSIPIRTILNFELKHEIYNSKKHNISGNSLFNINIKNQFDSKFTEYINRFTNESNVEESQNTIKSKLLMLSRNVTHNYCIQEIINFSLCDVKQIRIETIRDLDTFDIDLFRQKFLSNIFGIIKNIKLLASTTFQWQMLFQFVNIFREYFNQLDFIILEIIPRSRSQFILNIETETFLLFYFFLSYLPLLKDIDKIVEIQFDVIKKVTEIRESEKLFFDELFIESQALLIIMLSGLVILRYDLLSDAYEKYIINMVNLEILPNKPLNSLINCEMFIKRYFSEKITLFDQFVDLKQENKNNLELYLEFCDQTYNLNRDISITDFISTLLRYIYQNSKEDYNKTLENYFILQDQEHSIKVFSDKDKSDLLQEIFVFSNDKLINNYCFGLFSFFDIIFDNFSEKDEVLSKISYYHDLAKTNTKMNPVNLAFQTICFIKLFEHDILNVNQLFRFVDEHFLGKNDYFENEQNDEKSGILIKAFCFSFIYYSIVNSDVFRNHLKNDQVNKLNEHSLIVMNIVKYYISIKFFENLHSNETQPYIISSILLIKGSYWVPWSAFLNKKPFLNISELDELCEIIYKNQIISVKKEIYKGINENSSSIDFLMASCINDPIKISICIQFLFSQITNLSISLENRTNYHSRDNYFEKRVLNRSSLLFAIICKLDISTKSIVSIISNFHLGNGIDDNLINELTMIIIILKSISSSNLFDHFNNFDISKTLESILFQITIPLLKLMGIHVNSKFIEWIILSLTDFLSFYLLSNSKFSIKLVNFGNFMIDHFIKNSQENELIILSYTKIIGIIVLTFDSDISILKNFLISFFNKLLKFKKFEMYVVSGIINLREILNADFIKRKPLVVLKINSVIIKLLSEITFNSVILKNRIINNSIRLLVTSLYEHLSQISPNEIDDFILNINPLMFDKLILDNKVSIDILHNYYINMSSNPSIYEINSILLTYNSYIKQDVSYENQILNFLYCDVINSVKLSRKQILTITLLLSLLLTQDFGKIIINNSFNDNSEYCITDSGLKTNNWDDIRNFFFMDKVDNPKVENWERIFFNNDGIIFLSKNYYSTREFPHASIDTNEYYGEEFLSWNLYEYPEIFLNKTHDKKATKNWRKSISSLLTNVNYTSFPHSEIQEPEIEQITQILYTLLNRMDEDLKTVYKQFRSEIIRIIKELEKQYNI